ncbi:uncharacterized protein C16orf74 homolog [Pleurodeles waltl]|uniref:uncharacterized protein C16orf74 homolog n=1 Tax=Pleurodeles waltl TaxID=8319 RepID=UPI003709A505
MPPYALGSINERRGMEQERCHVLGVQALPREGFKVCVSGGEQEREATSTFKEEGQLQVPSIIITPPTPTGETSSNEEEGGQDPPAKPY